MTGVEDNEAEVIAEVECGIAGVGEESIEECIEEGCLFAGAFVSALDFVIADPDDERNESAILADHVFAVVAEEGEADIDRFAVVVAEVPADDREHRILARRLDVIGDGVHVHAAIPTADEVNRVRSLGWHRAKTIRRRGILANFELIIRARSQVGQFAPEHREIGHRVRLRFGLLRLPFVVRFAVINRCVRRLPASSHPLDDHGRRRIAEPGQKQRAGLEREIFRGLSGVFGWFRFLSGNQIRGQADKR